LDSGYLSRLLRSLEAAGLITVAVSAQDRRVRVAELTTKGRKERGLLNRRSNKLAQSMLAPLTATDRDRLVTAMGEVNRILTSTMIHIEPIDPAHRLAQYCLANYLAELDHRFETGFDPAQSLPCEPDDLRPPNGLLLMASLYGEAVGCGALKVNEARPTEIKRMWVSPDARGMGIGRRMLEALEQHAEDFPSRVLHLETNRNLFETVSLYRSAGYKEVDAFNNEQYAHHWFEKHL
jgi:GNAT superfamily N-acetyltransferase